MSEAAEKCPVCGTEGSLTDVSYSDALKVGEHERLVEGLLSGECSHCGAQPLLARHIAHNQLLLADLKRKDMGLLTGNQIRSIRKSLGLSQKDAAEIFGGGANAFSKYERGDVIQSVAMDKLLRLVWRVPGNLSVLQAETRFADVETRYERVDQSEWTDRSSGVQHSKLGGWPMNLSGYFKDNGVANEDAWQVRCA